MAGEADVVVILENDLYRRAKYAEVDAFLESAAHVIVLDSLENATNLQASVIFPAGTFVEANGTWVNSEGRAQRAYQVFVPDGEILGSWQWLRELIKVSERQPEHPWEVEDDVLADMARAIPIFKPVLEIAPPAGYRIEGQKIPRQPFRYSGRTSMHADIDVNEPKPPDDPDTPLAFSMEGFEGQPPAPLITRFWAPGWNSIQSLNKFQSEVGGALKGGDPGQRLIEPGNYDEVRYFQDVPASAFAPKKGAYLPVPLYHIFGSEPMSMLTAGIAERAPKPYLALNPSEAEKLGFLEGENVVLQIDGTSTRLSLVIIASLPVGTIGLPAGLTGSLGNQKPTWAQVIRSDDNE